MRFRFFPLLAAVALTVISACGGGEAVPVQLSIVPNPVSIQYEGRGVKLPANATMPRLYAPIDKDLAPEE